MFKLPQKSTTKTYLYESDVYDIKSGLDSYNEQRRLAEIDIATKDEIMRLSQVNTVDVQARVALAKLTSQAEEMGMYTIQGSGKDNTQIDVSIGKGCVVSASPEFVMKSEAYGKKCLGRVKLSTLEGDLGLVILSLKEKAWKIEDFSAVAELVALLSQAEAKLKKLKDTND